MFAKFFAGLSASVFNAIAAAILKNEAAKEWLASSIGDRVNVKALAPHIDYDALYDELDTSDLSASIGKHISASDVAAALDAEDIAQHVEIDYYDLASHYEASEIASHLDLSDIAREVEVDADDVTVDYEALAKALLAQFARAKAVEVRSSSK